MSHLDELIERCDALLSGDFEQDKAVDIYGEYCISYKRAIYQETGSQIPTLLDKVERKYIVIIQKMLLAHRDRMNHQLDLARASSGSTAVSTSVNVNVSVSISQTIEALEKCSLDPEERKEIEAALAELEASKSKGAEAICDKASKVLDLVKKGVDVATAVAPFVAAALSAIS